MILMNRVGGEGGGEGVVYCTGTVLRVYHSSAINL